MKAARDQGLHGIEHIQRMGSDPDGMFGVIGAEEFHWGCAGIALAISGSGLAAAGLAASGTPEQIARWVPECFGVGDEIKLGAYAVTEAQAGSDVKSLRTTARRDGDEWVLNGTKVFITNGGIADVHVVVANTAPELGHRGQASFVIEKGTPGLSQGKKESKLGIRASHTAEVVLEDCRIPVDNLLGGMEKLERKLDRARSRRGLARLERARDLRAHPADRRRLGARHRPGRVRVDARVPRRRPGADVFELPSTTARPRAAAARAPVGPAGARPGRDRDRGREAARPARLLDGPQRIPLTGGQGSMSKLKSGQVAVWATRTLIDLVGPYAGTRECPLEKWFRDAKIYELFEGTAEIQRLVISRMQAAEYRERLLEAAAIAAEATEPALGGSVAATS